ncbi:Cytochrome p450 [Thalictrum thalictroides]|uniref:Cytochrome p450 n=1 Tax=Thalictrum thalictroides TaxID=46969 RepID=A0A7J6UWB3_THATH|nr:Cytochrome p450 [Thalictrum thalictroides]
MGREIMKTHDVVFSNRPITTAAKEFLYGGKDVAFAPLGEYWRQMRRVCVIDLLSLKRVQSFEFVREEEIANMVNKINQACLMKSDVNLTDLISVITNNIISRVALGRSLEGKSEGAKLTKEVMEHFGVFSVGDMFPSLGWIDELTGLKKRMRKTSTAMHRFLDEVVEEHLISKKEGAQADRKDLVDLLLEAEKDPTLGVEFTRQNLRAVIMDMFVAGTDTTYTTLEWAMSELANLPVVMKKVQEEVRQVIGKTTKVNESDTSKMNYFNCVIKETLRMHPALVLSLPRVSTSSTNIQGYQIPDKTRVIVNLWAICRDPQVWDKPNEFIPERFMNNSIDFRGKDFEFIPFGAGRRGCPGLTFGLMSVEAILANLLYWFDWELNSGAEKIDMTEAFGLSVNLEKPLRLVPKAHLF